MKKHCLKMMWLLILCTALTNQTKAQYGLTLNYIKPTGGFGYYFKPTVGVEFNFQLDEIDDQVMASGNIGYYSLTATQPQFTTFARQYGGSNGLSFLPGSESWLSYQVLTIGAGIGYKIFDKSFSPFVGLDLAGYFASYHRTYSIQTLITSDEEDNMTSIAIRPKLGLSWEVSPSIRIQSGIAQSIARNFEASESEVYWQPFLSVQAFLD